MTEMGKNHELATVMTDYLRVLREEKRLRPSSLRNYEFELRILLENLTKPTDTFLIRDHLRKLSPATVSRKLMIWRPFLEFCGGSWNGALNEIKNPKIRRKQPKFLTENESFLLEQACFRSETMARDRLFIALGLQLGLRLSEILALKFKNIEAGWLKIIRKGEKEQRLPLTPSLQTLAEQWRQEIKATDDDWIFSGSPRLGENRPLSSRAAQYLLDRLTKMAGLDKEISPHALRHTFATRLASNGANLVAIKELLGHENLATTERYLHVTPTHLKETLEFLKSTGPT